MKYNKVVKDNLGNRNAFIYSMVFSILLCVFICYFGIDSKGTNGAFYDENGNKITGSLSAADKNENNNDDGEGSESDEESENNDNEGSLDGDVDSDNNNTGGNDTGDSSVSGDSSGSGSSSNGTDGGNGTGGSSGTSNGSSSGNQTSGSGNQSSGNISSNNTINGSGSASANNPSGGTSSEENDETTTITTYEFKFISENKEYAVTSCEVSLDGTCELLLPKENPTKVGFTFKGWSLTYLCSTNDIITSSYIVNGSNIYYACFEMVVNTTNNNSYIWLVLSVWVIAGIVIYFVIRKFKNKEVTD